MEAMMVELLIGGVEGEAEVEGGVVLTKAVVSVRTTLS
jgi:hypothetical protein